LIMAFWVLLGTLFLAYMRLRQRGIRGMGQAFMGMILAHCGVAVTVIGVAVSSGYGVGDDVSMSPGKSVTLAGYQITFVSEEPLHGPNYHGTQAHMTVRHGNQIKSVYPEKRLYDVAQMAMTDSAIDVTPFRDIYVALGEPLGQSAWSVRLYFKPFVRWIWAGGFLILFGGLLALTDRRYARSN
ncbi:MAG: hypothetical protein OJI67_09005, partial [Prosthecobacter sp.]|nr:hypothetical protein [Prosthecobacter sp.]